MSYFNQVFFSQNKVSAPSTGGGIVLDNLVFNLDAGNPLSYTGDNMWYDLTTNNLDATLTNFTFSNDVGGSIVFQISNGYGTIPHFNYNREEFSSGAWIKWGGVQGSNMYGFWETGGGCNNEWATAITGNWIVGVQSPGCAFNYLTTQETSPVDTWVYFSYTFDGPNQTVSIYENGVFLESMNISFTEVNTYTRVFEINGFPAIPRPDISWGMLHMYNGLLTSDQILSNYNNTKARFGY